MFVPGLLLSLSLGSVDAHAASAKAPSTPPPAAPPCPPPPDDTHLKLKKRGRGQQHGVALSLSGALAGRLIIEGTGEVNLPGQSALAIILGGGGEYAWGEPLWKFAVVQGGLQYRYTVKGDFDTGLYVGLEGLASLRPVQVGMPLDVGISPMLGFKYTAPFGLVADIGAGPSLVVTTYGPVRPSGMFNLQLGWAFGKAPKGG